MKKAMTIAEFMSVKITTVQKIIVDFKDPFTSHEFIEKFSKKFEPAYIDFLNQYGKKGSFKIVHGQIARFLSVNSPILGIKKLGKFSSRTVFGDMDRIEKWEKI